MSTALPPISQEAGPSPTDTYAVVEEVEPKSEVRSEIGGSAVPEAVQDFLNDATYCQAVARLRDEARALTEQYFDEQGVSEEDRKRRRGGVVRSYHRQLKERDGLLDDVPLPAMVLLATPGVGKTHQSLEMAASQREVKVDFFCQTVKAGIEAQELVEHHGGVFIRPRNALAIEVPHDFTEDAPEYQALKARGVDLDPTLLCPLAKNAEIMGDNELSVTQGLCVQCPLRHGCGYRKQFAQAKEAPVVIRTHGYLTSTAGDIDERSDCVIIDESFGGACLAKRHVSWDQITEPQGDIDAVLAGSNIEDLHIVRQARQALHRYIDRCQARGGHTPHEIRFYEPMTAIQAHPSVFGHAAAVLRKRKDEIAKQSNGCHVSAKDLGEFMKRYDVKTITDFLIAFEQMTKACEQDVPLGNGRLHQTKKGDESGRWVLSIDYIKDPNIPKTASVLLLDASFCERLTNYVLPRDWQVRQCDVDQGLDVVIMRDWATQNSMRAGNHENPRIKRRLISDLAGGLIGRDQACFLAATSRVIKAFEEDREEGISTLPEGWKLEPFGKLRSVNSFKDFGGALIIGQAMPSYGAFEIQAAAFEIYRGTHRAIEPYALSGEPLENAPFPRDDCGYFYHPDPAVLALIEARSEEETYQTAGRLRGARNPSSKTVILVNNFPNKWARKYVKMELDLSHALGDRIVNYIASQLLSECPKKGVDGGTIPENSPVPPFNSMEKNDNSKIGGKNGQSYPQEKKCPVPPLKKGGKTALLGVVSLSQGALATTMPTLFKNRRMAIYHTQRCPYDTTSIPSVESMVTRDTFLRGVNCDSPLIKYYYKETVTINAFLKIGRYITGKPGPTPIFIALPFKSDEEIKQALGAVSLRDVRTIKKEDLPPLPGASYLGANLEPDLEPSIIEGFMTPRLDFNDAPSQVDALAEARQAKERERALDRAEREDAGTEEGGEFPPLVLTKEALYEAGQLTMMVIKPHHQARGATAGKVFEVDAKGRYKKSNEGSDPRSMGRTFTGITRDLTSFEDLSGLVRELGDQPSRFVVRGTPALSYEIPFHPYPGFRGNHPNHQRIIVERKYRFDDTRVIDERGTTDLITFTDMWRGDGRLEDVPKNWLCLDVDNFSMPMGIDPSDDPEYAARTLLSALGEPFSSAGCHVQLSASFALTAPQEIFKGHLWFWLKSPLSCSMVRLILAKRSSARGAKLMLGDDVAIDSAPLSAASVLYTADPRIKPAPGVGDVVDVSDPVPCRHIVIEGKSLDLGVETSEPQQALERAQSLAGMPLPQSVVRSAPGRFIEACQDIGDEKGFFDNIKKACWWGAKGMDRDEVIATISRFVVEADPGHRTHEEIQRYGSDAFLGPLIDWHINRSFTRA